MTIPSRLSSYLDQQGARYKVCVHAHSRSSPETARTAHIPPAQLAKSVVLEDDNGDRVVAIVPGDKRVMLGALSRLLDRHDLRLADERSIAELFTDCEAGAVPALGMAWGVETVVDDALESSEVVYIEAGDHERLLKLSQEQFRALMRNARHGHFCADRVH
jgi:Ala-tRNA(Pro) deacylase